MRPCALLVGGTSSWAKEVLLRWALRTIADRDKIERELLIREIAEPLDLKALAMNGIEVQTEFITGGCFCCTSKIDLEIILRECNKGKLPSNMVIETPITANLDAVRKIVATEMKEIDITSLFALESETYSPLMETFPDLMERNLSSADLVVLTSKLNLTESIEKLDVDLSQRMAFTVELEGSLFQFLVNRTFSGFTGLLP